jgi:hypothetical protein
LRKEEKMWRKTKMNLEELKLLHGQGLSDAAIGKRLGSSGSNVGLQRRKLALPSNDPRRKAGGNSSKPRKIHDASLREGIKSVEKAQRAAARGAAWIATIEDLARQRDRFQAAIDALYALTEA